MTTKKTLLNNDPNQIPSRSKTEQTTTDHERQETFMERWNRQTTNTRLANGLIAAFICTPFIAAGAFAAPPGSSDKLHTDGAIPPAPHTVQESISDSSGALPPPVAKRYVKLRRAPGFGLAQMYIALDLSTPWTLGYIQTYAQPSVQMSPWGTPFYNGDAFGN